MLAMKLGLESVSKLAERLGNPQHQFPAIHIAGTNGKGSTAAMTEAILRAANLKVGLFTSPHLVSITERCQINGQKISEEEFARLATIVREAAETLVAAGKLFYPVAVRAVVIPASALLSATDRNDLKTKAIAAIQDAVAECGIGEAVIYNRLVQRLMAIEGVLDVTLDLWANVEGSVIPSHRNLIPPATLRPTVLESEGGMVAVDVGARLVALDLRVKIELKGAGLLGNVATNLEDARVQVAGQLRAEVDAVTSLSVAELMKLVVDSEFYAVTGLEFTMEYVDAGVRLHTTFTTASPAVAVSSLERLWVRTVRLLEDA